MSGSYVIVLLYVLVRGALVNDFLANFDNKREEVTLSIFVDVDCFGFTLAAICFRLSILM